MKLTSTSTLHLYNQAELFAKLFKKYNYQQIETTKRNVRADIGLFDSNMQALCIADQTLHKVLTSLGSYFSMTPPPHPIHFNITI